MMRDVNFSQTRICHKQLQISQTHNDLLTACVCVCVCYLVPNNAKHPCAVHYGRADSIQSVVVLVPNDDLMSEIFPDGPIRTECEQISELQTA